MLTGRLEEFPKWWIWHVDQKINPHILKLFRKRCNEAYIFTIQKFQIYLLSPTTIVFEWLTWKVSGTQAEGERSAPKTLFSIFIFFQADRSPTPGSHRGRCVIPCCILRNPEYDKQRRNDLQKHKNQNGELHHQNWIVTCTFAKADKKTYWIGWFMANKIMNMMENVAYRAQDSIRIADTVVYGELWLFPDMFGTY